MARFKHTKYPKEIIEDVIGYMTYEEGKDFTDTDVASLTSEEVFDCVVKWDGTSNSPDTIKEWIRDIFGVDLSKTVIWDGPGERVEYTLVSKKTGKRIPRIFYSKEDVDLYLSELSNKSNWTIVSRIVTYKDWV